MSAPQTGWIGEPQSFIEITLTYEGDGSHPVNGYVTITSISNGGIATVMSGPTNLNGQFDTMVTWTQPGATQFTYNVQWDNGGHKEGIIRPGPTIEQETIRYSIYFDSAPPNYVNQAVPMHVTCTYQPTGHRVNGASVRVSAVGPSGSSVSPGSGTTDSSGEFHFTYRSPNPGQAQLSTSVSLHYPNGIDASVSYSGNGVMPTIVATPTPAPTPTPVPVAAFSCPATGTVGVAVSFTDQSTNSPTAWDWNWGDGTAHGTTKNPTHSYSTTGSKTVTLTATNAGGSSRPVSKSIMINTAPTPTPTPPPLPPGQTSTPTPTVSPSAKPSPTATASLPATPTPASSPTPPVVAAVTATPTPVPVTAGDENKPLPVAVVAAGGVVVVAGLVLLFLWMRLVPKVSLPGSSVPGFGGTSPVTVSLANGLGMKRAARQDTLVELSTSAGSITGSVNIPKGQQSGQAMLTSSNECGPVKVSAKAGNKTGTAKVSFNCGPLSLELVTMPESLPADGKSTANVTIRTKDQQGRYVAMIEERSVHLTASLGSVVTPVKIPARAMTGSAVLTAGKTMGITVINATSGAARGECKMDMSGSAGRYCMHCGSSMALEDAKCRKCGNVPPSGVDVKECPNCSTVIPEAAKFCYKCGAVQPVAASPAAVGQPADKK